MSTSTSSEPTLFLHSTYRFATKPLAAPVSYYDLTTWPQSPMPVLFQWYRDAEVEFLKYKDCPAAPWPNNIQLATCDSRGRAHVRHLLMKGLDERGPIFFTNYDSAKAREMRDSPYVSVCLYWKSLERQVRIEGRVERLSDAESTAYFQARPLASQISSVSSPQSSALTSRLALEQHYVSMLSRVAEEIRSGGGGDDSSSTSTSHSVRVDTMKRELTVSDDASSAALRARHDDALRVIEEVQGNSARTMATQALKKGNASGDSTTSFVVERPDHWGGYVVIPERIEFWSEGEYRLHNRMAYERDDANSAWKISILAP